MIGLLVELIISWLLLWLFDQSNLLVLGWALNKKRSFDFALGFLSASLFCVLFYMLTSYLTNSNFVVNKAFKTEQFLKSSWWVLVSVLFEEFLFRGALLYIAIKKFGVNRACIASAIAFGIYHWFSYGVLGNPVQMLIVFLMTGIWGLMFAYAYAKTKSLYLPCGLHLGWNLVNTIVFSKGPLGHQFLIIEGGKKLEGILSLIIFILPIITMPILTYLYLRKSNNTLNEDCRS